MRVSSIRFNRPRLLLYVARFWQSIPSSQGAVQQRMRPAACPSMRCISIQDGCRTRPAANQPGKYATPPLMASYPSALPERELIANPLDSIVVDMMRMIFNVLVELIEKLCHSICFGNQITFTIGWKCHQQESRGGPFQFRETLNSPSLLLNSLLTRIRAFLVLLITITLSPFFLFEILVIWMASKLLNKTLRYFKLVSGLTWRNRIIKEDAGMYLKGLIARIRVSFNWD